jgi:ligand-binding sensor domain-containing protein
MPKQKHPFLFFHYLIILLLITQCCLAQLPGYKSFKLGEANSSNKIFTLFKNKQGYIFTGCSDGLYKFDGNQFKKIEVVNSSVTDTVTTIFQGINGQIWAGFQSGNIAVMNNGKLDYIHPEEGTPKKGITAFAQDLQGNIWLGTRGEGIYYFRGKRMYLINEEDGLSDLNIHALAVSASGDIIAATDNGINICSVKGTAKKITIITPQQGLPDYIVTSIVAAGNDQFWIGLQDKGICLYDHHTQKIIQPSAVNNWNKGQVNNLLYSNGNVWIATQDNGLINFVASQNKLITVPVLNNQQKSITSIIDDKEGNLWLVADNKTLIRTASNSLLLFPLYDKALFETIHTILADHENNLWVGSDLMVIKYTSPESGVTSKKYPIPGLDMKTDITSLYQDKFHNIWIGSMGKGIFLLNPATGENRQLKEVFTSGSNSILSITGNGNTVCAAGLEGALVFELTDENREIKNTYQFTSYNNIKNTGSTYIYNVFKDSKERIWFATDGKGLTMLQQGNFSHYDNNNGIKDNHIYSITEDKQGRIWFSTSNAGIYSFDGKTFTNYTLRDGLSNLAVSSIKTDRQGNIVVVHPSGLDIIHPQTGNISYINGAQGIIDVNTDMGAICSDSSGNIFTATQNGILKYTALPGIQPMPVTIIESIQLFLKDIDTGTLQYFKYDENNFTFNFNGLYYSNSGNIFYQYKLEGLDSNWQLTTDDSKSFPKLPPNKYVFRVRSSLNKNFRNTSEAAFAFEIAKPFWRTWWFITIAVLISGALLYWYIRTREGRLKHVERLRQEKIEFQFQVLRNQVNPHFLFNSFNTLISTIEENPAVAVQYVEQLSDFFRNIVTYRDKDMISLEEEIGLLQTYFYLQQKRYGNYLQLQINLTGHDEKEIFLPPLTLQLLMENAIKHNAVSKEALLTVQLFAQDDYLVIKNNINIKTNSETGTGMGLQNIINRYAMLTDKKVTVHKTNEYFTVSLPILKQS